MLPGFPYEWASTPLRLTTAIAVTIGFALLARALRGVNGSGMAAGGAACFLLFAAAGPVAFAALAALFLLTWVTTRLGYRRKQQKGLAEPREGRNAKQVLANLGVAAGSAAAFAASRHPGFVLASIAALAEAATDTVASEVGQSSSDSAILVTSWQRVPAGTDGGITLAGTLAGTMAGLAVSAIAGLGGLLPWSAVWIAAAAGFAGMVLDGCLGATLQRRGWIDNETVNLIATLASAGAVLAVGG